MCLTWGTMHIWRNSSNNSVESQKRREIRMHARRVVTSHGRYLVMCTRAYAYNHFPPTNLQTYHRTLYPSICARQGVILLWRTVVARAQIRAAARSWGQTGRIFALDPLLLRHFTSFLSYSPRDRERPFFWWQRKKNCWHVAIKMKRYDEIIGKVRDSSYSWTIPIIVVDKLIEIVIYKENFSDTFFGFKIKSPKW